MCFASINPSAAFGRAASQTADFAMQPEANGSRTYYAPGTQVNQAPQAAPMAGIAAAFAQQRGQMPFSGRRDNDNFNGGPARNGRVIG